MLPVGIRSRLLHVDLDDEKKAEKGTPVSKAGQNFNRTQ
jgi:hypothetical protein